MMMMDFMTTKDFFSSSALVSLVLSEPHIRPPDHFGSQGSQKHPLNAEFKN